VAKLETASNEFEKAADAALGAGSVTDVPDWPTEAREMIVRAYNERKMKEAARLIREQLQIARWDEIKN